jgi:hypothetical protein
MKKKTFNNETDLLEILLTILNNKMKIFLIAALTTAILLLGFQITQDDKVKITTELRPISIFDEALYESFNFITAGANNVGKAFNNTSGIFFNQMIDKKTLFNLFTTTIEKDIKKSVDRFFLSKREDYDNEKVYRDAVNQFLLSIKIDTTKKIIEFESRNKGEEKDWINFLSFLQLNTNKSVQKFIQLRMNKTLSGAILIKNNKIEDIERAIESSVKNYELMIKMRISFLEEQATLAREGNIVSNINPLDSKSGIKNFSETLYYLKGYQVIEKEIELIKNRKGSYNFVTGIPILEKNKDALTNQQTIKRIEAGFNKTPISSDDKFLAGSVMISSSKFKRSKISINNMIILSCFIGIIIGVLCVIIQNASLNILRPRRN